ncbi:hypothetical protein BG011_000860 [Mortierella polycephala]|uniref:EF-hand domain-containing protein n=1 Tax=Mortierella polycephala TaxID=41804 RepID=A0A9P6QGS4_9FUNG|nr:hypothetical protein BG011_000860 [Mortierella polycephala]
MSITATEPDPSHTESAKDRTSIKLMDLPMQKKSKHKDRNKDMDIDSTTDKDKNSDSSSTSTSANNASSLPPAVSKSKPKANPDNVDNSNSNSNNDNDSDSNKSNIEFDSDPKFLPSESNDQQQLQSVDQDVKDSSLLQNRMANPPHYETREERQIRIRKQFNQLAEKRSGFLDTNSLISFFAEVTSDEDVQRRYADELLQLCHSRKLHRINNGAASTTGTLNQDNGDGAGTRQDNDESRTDSLDQRNRYHDQEDGAVESDADYVMHGSSAQTKDQKQRHHGQIHYEDFEVFVEEKEERLWNLFREIDHNNDNEIQADELQASLAKAGIKMSDTDLQKFINAMDKDGDGAIDYEEWRDFLVLLPREPTLKEIYHYVQEVVAQVGVDGDVVMPPSDTDYVAKYLLAGAIAGAVSRTATAPLDRLKVYLITHSVPALTGPAAQAGLKHIPKFTGSNVVAPPKQRLLWTAITELYRHGGIKTFFRGNGLNIIKIVPESAIKFYTYETSKSLIVRHLPSLTLRPTPQQQGGARTQHSTAGQVPEIATSGRFLAGGIAGLASQFSIYPLETIKTRIMSSTGRSRGTQNSSAPLLPGSASTTSSSLSTTSAGEPGPNNKTSLRVVAREMWQKAGLRAFYRGLGPALVGVFPYAAIDLSVFETVKFGYMRWKAGVKEGAEGSEEKSLERPSVFVLLACGTISGSVGATSVYPLSLVRTRLQAQGTPHHPQTYSSTLDVFKKTFEQEGIRGFYKGMVPTLTKVVPAVSISYVVYEYSKRELGL